MAIYEYQCESCNHIFERMHKKETAKETCPDCSGQAKKVMSSSTYRMNGYSEKNGYSKKS